MSTASPRLAQAEYEALIGRIRDSVRAVLPEGCTVAVVSRGDDALLELDGRTGWHFPRSTDGGYAGHHPYDSAEAIGQLEDLRAEGAEYLLLPTTSFWWLGYYKGLAQHLQERYELRFQDEGTCMIFSLHKGTTTAEAAPQVSYPSIDTRYSLLVTEIQDLAGNVLPSDATVAVVSRGDNDLLDLGIKEGLHFPPGGNGEYSAPWPVDSEQAALELESIRERGAEYFLIPATEYWCLDYYPGFRHHLESRHRLVLRQQHVCAIYELLSEPPQVQAAPGAPSPSRPARFARFRWPWQKA